MALTVDHLGIVRAELFKARTKWYDIGLALNVPVTTLDSIGGQFDNHSDKLREALKVWLKTATEPIWQNVVDVLKSPVVGEPKLASDIEAKHCTTAEKQPTRATELQTLRQALQDSRELRIKDQQDSQRRIDTLQQELQDSQLLIEKLRAANNQLKWLLQNTVMQQKEIRDMRWQKESKAPEKMYRGSAAVDSKMAYFHSNGSTTVHSYDSNTRVWRQLPATPYTDSTLVMVHHILTMVGGQILGEATDSLLSLMGDKWLSNLPAMPTKRYWTAVVCSGHSLIVAGGWDGCNILSTVEVLDTNTRQWSIASSLTHPFTEATISICGERLYMLSGADQTGVTRSVLSCSVPELLQSCQPQSLAGKLRTVPANQSTIWRRVADAPHYG